MTTPTPIPRKSPLHKRLARKLLRAARVPFKPLLEKLRDRQAPALHRWMMHTASVPMEPTLKSALIVAPHHDDETFGCGGLIAMKRDAGVPVHILLMTDGGKSHSHIASVDAQKLVQTRKLELVEACKILGVTEENIHFLDLPDQGVYRLNPTEHQAAAVRVADLIRTLKPEELYVNHRTDRHPDHEAVYRVIADALGLCEVKPRVFQYPIWLIWKGPYRWDAHPKELAGAGRLDVRSVQDRKNQAIQAYASQLPVLPPGFVEQFMQGYELFFPVS